MSSNLNQLIEELQTSYVIGSRESINTESIDGDFFSHKLREHIVTRLSFDDRLILRIAGNLSDQGLQAARLGKSRLAEQLFLESRSYLYVDNLSIEGKLLHQSFLEQAEAYFDYRHNDFQKVFSRSHKSLLLDIDLENNYGYDILHIHRIQVLHNIVRTNARCRKFESAFELAGSLLGYLQGTLLDLPISHSWGMPRIISQPKELLETMFIQITSEISLILSGMDTNIAIELLSIAFLSGGINPKDDSLYPLCYAWFQAKVSYLNKNINEFLKYASNILILGKSHNPILWYAIITDIFALDSFLGNKCLTNLNYQIKRDYESWKGMPKKFSNLIAC